MADYQLVAGTPGMPDSGTVLRRSDQAFIPDDPDNVDRAEYSAWLAAGNTPDPPDPVPEPPPPPPDPNARLDAGIQAAADVMAAPVTEPAPAMDAPATAAELAALQVQVSQLQEAVKQMLVAQSEIT